MGEFNSDVVAVTLRQLVSILGEHHIRYRILGSVVAAAMHGGLHRRLGDCDLVVGEESEDKLYAELTERGYTPAGGMFAFARRYLALEQLVHPTLLSIGYFYGRWERDGSLALGGDKFRLVIDAYALKETKYMLYGTTFNGLPGGAIAAGIIASRNNPKREKELALIAQKKIAPFSNTYIHTSIMGVRMDWIYHFFTGLLNHIGSIRVWLGMTYDPWR